VVRPRNKDSCSEPTWRIHQQLFYIYPASTNRMQRWYPLILLGKGDILDYSDLLGLL